MASSSNRSNQSSTMEGEKTEKAGAKETTEEHMFNAYASKLTLTHPLSYIDQSVSRKYVRRMFVFDYPIVTPDAIQEASTALRRGLKVAFKHYPFLTGMVGPAAHTNRDYVTLRYGASEELRQIRNEIFHVMVHKESEVWEHIYDDLCRRGMPTGHLKPEEYCATASWKLFRWTPAFALQANFREDGALILCFEFQHSIADGTSIGLFLDVFASGVRGDPTVHSIVEYSGVDINAKFESEIQDRHKETSTDDVLGEDFPEWDFGETPLPPCSQIHDSHIFTMSARVIREMTRHINTYLKETMDDTIWVSTTDCVCALLWFYIMRARRLTWPAKGCSNQLMFTSAVNTRPHLKDELSTSHFGNMFTTISVPQLTEDTDFERTSAGHLAMPDATMEEIADKALEIRTQLEEVDREYILQRLAVLSSLEKPTKASIAAQRACKATVGGIKFGSLVGFGADIDFGIPGTAEGRPRWCRKPWMHDEGMINILPRRGGTGGDAPWEILVCLPKGIIKAMLKWTEFGQFVDRRVNDGDALDHVRHQAKPFCRRLLYLDSETTRMIDTSNDWSGGDGKC